jgi:selenide,water dikinase
MSSNPDTASLGQEIRLTSMSSCAGCAAKLSPEVLAQILGPVKNIFDPKDYPDLMVGLEAPDDAAVWRIDEDRAIVMTTDFFTPVVDDPYDFGAIAATNAISDIYAMGGKPFLALNIAALPASLPVEFLSKIIQGGADKAREAGVVVAGGHTIQDKEPKYGLVVLGFVDPHKVMTKGGAHPGERLVLTKPLGFGVTNTAIKQELTTPAEVSEVVGWMTTLNARAADLAAEFGLKCVTDVTGFGLIGHGSEMAGASGVAYRYHFDQLPFVSGARRFADKWTFPGGAFNNKLHYGGLVQFDDTLDEASQMLLFDPQTSGGLLMSVPADRIEAFLQRAKEMGQPAWEIGEVVAGSGIQVV